MDELAAMIAGGGSRSCGRRGDLEKRRREEYLEEREREKEKEREREMQRVARISELHKEIEHGKQMRSKRKHDGGNGDDQNSNGLGLLSIEDIDSWADETLMDEEDLYEVFEQLRAIGEPCTLFGESDKGRYLRLVGMSSRATQDDDECGQTNVLQQVMHEEAPAVEAPVQAEDEGSLKPEDREIIRWIRRVLKAWETELGARPDEMKQTAAGRNFTAQYRQTKQYLKPLLSRLKTGSLDEEIQTKLHSIAKLSNMKKYREANEFYMLLAIGDAPWPVGVTQWGIQDRAANDKIGSNQCAHILNDETTRKYIQCVKRLITKSQEMWPADDPSDMDLSSDFFEFVPAMSALHTTTHFAGYSCQFSPFNSTLLGVATAQYYGIVGNGKLVVLDISRPAHFREYLTKDGCFDLAWAEDNDNIVFAGTGDGSIKVFDITSPSGNLPIANLVGHTAEMAWIECNAMVPTLLGSVGWDRVINVWDLPKGSVGLRLEGRHAGVIYACSWSPRNASWLATVGGDAKICVHDIKAGNQTPPAVVIPHAHDGEILSCDWHKYADGVIVTAGVDRVVRSWDLRNPSAPLVTMAGHELAVRRVRCHPHNSRMVISGGYDMAVIVWDLEATSAPGHLVDRFDHHSEFVYGVDLSLFTSNLAASVGWDRQVRVWDITKGEDGAHVIIADHHNSHGVIGDT
ncbi:peroxisomal targeting signal 2 receptor [Perkinsus olseni]|uniref:Peroxin-7 n=1 Tax=Perkinsus olseni TaxID=32597 RepID=A0A7J6LPJ0_PEROL|nr:peroxisomal targeting signal 2 receptor [Perkinsus olseni]KAF4661127.1 peroxisomal targeting signal 2 receptor [Perkinsus olseni]